MKTLSRKQLAHTVVTMLDQRPRADVIKALAYSMVTQRRTRDIDLFVREISRELLAQRGHLEVTVTTARRPSETLTGDIITFFQQFSQAQTVALKHCIDPNILGGLIATTSEYELDTSLRHKLQILEVPHA